MHVLIADDDPVLGQLLSAAFRKEGWSCSIARDAMQSVMFAMRQPQARRHSARPEHAGRRRDGCPEEAEGLGENSRHPGIVISGAEAPDLPAQATELGAVAFMPKPLDPEVLVAHLKEAIPDKP